MNCGTRVVQVYPFNQRRRRAFSALRMQGCRPSRLGVFVFVRPGSKLRVCEQIGRRTERGCASDYLYLPEYLSAIFACASGFLLENTADRPPIRLPRQPSDRNRGGKRTQAAEATPGSAGNKNTCLRRCLPPIKKPGAWCRPFGLGSISKRLDKLMTL